MKNILIVLFLATSFMACKSKKNNVEMILLNFTSTQDYCGGAAPPDELINKLNTPKPFTGTIYLNRSLDLNERSTSDIMVKFVDGKAKIPKLEPGLYVVFLYPYASDESINKLQEERPNFDPGCAIMKNEIIIQEIEILSTTTSVSTDIHLICDPCEEPRP